MEKYPSGLIRINSIFSIYTLFDIDTGIYNNQYSNLKSSIVATAARLVNVWGECRKCQAT